MDLIMTACFTSYLFEEFLHFLDFLPKILRRNEKDGIKGREKYKPTS
jgi:hypothetical protein